MAEPKLKSRYYCQYFWKSVTNMSAHQSFGLLSIGVHKCGNNSLMLQTRAAKKYRAVRARLS